MAGPGILIHVHLLPGHFGRHPRHSHPPLQKEPPAHFLTQGTADALTEQGGEEPGCPGSKREDDGRSRMKTPTAITPAKRALTAPQFHSLAEVPPEIELFQSDRPDLLQSVDEYYASLQQDAAH